jgi:hypothetical protein
MKHILPFAALAATAIAGEINVVQLGPPDVIRMEITCAGTSQPVDLRHGGTTGGFVLPEKEAVITIPNHEIPSLTIPATASPNIAVLSPGPDGYRWTLIPGKPTAEKWAMRVVNLATEPAKLVQEGDPLEIKTEATTEIAIEDKAGMTVAIEGGGKFTYDGREPCAVVAFIYKKEGEWKVLFVPDR